METLLRKKEKTHLTSLNAHD